MSTSIEHQDGIEQVREILVGSVQRDLERKLLRIEAHLSSRLTDLQQETRRRTDVIEAHLRKEAEALSARVEGELAELREGLRSVGRELREADATVGARITRVEEGLVRAQHELRTQILDQAKSFLDELEETRRELAETVARELEAFDVGGEEPEVRAPALGDQPGA